MTTENEELNDDLDLEEGTDTGESQVEEHEEQEEEATAKVDRELEEAEDDSEREAIRERRRKERKNRNQKAREKIEALEAKLNAVLSQNSELQQRVAAIQDTNTGTQIAQIDDAIRQAGQAVDYYKNIIAAATAKQDGKTVAEATEYMIASRDRVRQLSAFKENATRAMNAPKPLNPAMVDRSKKFLDSNRWYGGPQSTDPDSKVLTALDNSLAAEGWDSTTDAYWSELEKRAKRYLPHRFSKSDGETRRSPVSDGNTASRTGEKKGSFVLSPERVQAIKSAGAWEDIEARNKMIKQYQRYDRENGRK